MMIPAGGGEQALSPQTTSSKLSKLAIYGTAADAELNLLAASKCVTPVKLWNPEVLAEMDGGEGFKTPVGKEHRIPKPMTPPPAPRKRQPSSKLDPAKKARLAGEFLFASPPELQALLPPLHHR